MKNLPLRWRLTLITAALMAAALCVSRQFGSAKPQTALASAMALSFFCSTHSVMRCASFMFFTSSVPGGALCAAVCLVPAKTAKSYFLEYHILPRRGTAAQSGRPRRAGKAARPGGKISRAGALFKV